MEELAFESLIPGGKSSPPELAVLNATKDCEIKWYAKDLNKILRSPVQCHDSVHNKGTTAKQRPLPRG